MARADRGLAIWLVALVLFGVGGILFRLEELAALVAVAGLFVAAQAADLDPRWRTLNYAVGWVVPAFGFTIALASAIQVGLHGDLVNPARAIVVSAGIGAACLCALSALRPVATTLTAMLYRTREDSYTLRLAARTTLVLFAVCLPGWFAFRTMFEEFLGSSTNLVDESSLQAQLVGLVLLALAAVGFLIRRDARATLDRLGIGPMNLAYLGVALLGVVGLYALNGGADWIERRWFHAIWEEDRRVNEMIAGGLSGGGAALLGLTAGIGEEITMRGALQPKFGLIGTSLLFAVLHIQYSWFGMVVIFLLGLVLGWIRKRTNTSVAITVHTLYDVLAVIGVGQGT